jgi:hypothetical protein
MCNYKNVQYITIQAFIFSENILVHNTHTQNMHNGAKITWLHVLENRENPS